MLLLVCFWVLLCVHCYIFQTAVRRNGQNYARSKGFVGIMRIILVHITFSLGIILVRMTCSIGIILVHITFSIAFILVHITFSVESY
jgi:succinate-acetate transporter protein